MQPPAWSGGSTGCGCWWVRRLVRWCGSRHGLNGFAKIAEPGGESST